MSGSDPVKRASSDSASLLEGQRDPGITAISRLVAGSVVIRSRAASERTASAIDSGPGSRSSELIRPPTAAISAGV